MKVLDLYGFAGDDLEATRLALEKALGVRFKGHESSYWGGNYDLYESDDAVSLRLRYNRDLLWMPGDPPEERYAEPAYAEMGLLLDAKHPEPDSLKHLLLACVQGIKHLRREQSEPAV